VLIGESNVAIDPAIGGYGVADIYLGELSPHHRDPGRDSPHLRLITSVKPHDFVSNFV